MNTGQMMLTIAAFMLLGVVTLNLRTASFQNEEVLDGNEYTQKAVAIGRSLIEEMQEKPFDAAFNTKKIVKLQDLTSCGPGTGEKYPNFSDLDDFHGSVFRSPAPGVTPTTTTPKCLWDTWGYTVRVTVEYVSTTNPTVKVSGTSFAKRVTLSIFNSFSNETVIMSYLAAY
ncbi:MAG: hypothetical protein IH600_12200 [Bacteroidetes bacterium]|nr:hypothetical protein [Bacteroidota bacterium]